MNTEKSMQQQTDYKYGFSDDVTPKLQFDEGLTPKVVHEISIIKNEPKWMTDIRLDSYEVFRDKPDLDWGADLSGLDYEKIRYYVTHSDAPASNWDDVPKDIKNTFDKLGIPEAEQKFL